MGEAEPEAVVTSGGTGDSSDGQGVLSAAEREERRAALDALIGLMAPLIAQDGGELTLVGADLELGVVEVEISGACSSCAISATTLAGGVERILHERLAWVREVVGRVDDSFDPLESAARGRGAYVPAG